MVRRNSVPERWRLLKSVGDRIPGSRFIAFKVPFKMPLKQHVMQSKKFTPKDLINSVKEKKEELGLIIDLTNTERYYTSKDLPKTVQYVKLHTAGIKLPDDSTIHEFKKTVKRFLWQNADNDKLIGVHCTTGINRTGYHICRYLVDVDGWDPSNALVAFAQSRGHSIEGNAFIADILGGPNRSNVGIDIHYEDTEKSDAYVQYEDHASTDKTSILQYRDHFSDFYLDVRDNRSALFQNRHFGADEILSNDDRLRLSKQRQFPRFVGNEIRENGLRLNERSEDLQRGETELRFLPRTRIHDFQEENRDFINRERILRNDHLLNLQQRDIEEREIARQILHRNRISEGNLRNSSESNQRLNITNRSVPYDFPSDRRIYEDGPENRYESPDPHPMNFKPGLLMDNRDREFRDIQRPFQDEISFDMPDRNIGLHDISPRGRFHRPYPHDFRQEPPFQGFKAEMVNAALHEMGYNQQEQSILCRQRLNDMESRNLHEDPNFHSREPQIRPNILRAQRMDELIDERMHPEDVPRQINQSRMQEALQDYRNNRDRRIFEGMKTHPSEQLIRGANRFSPYNPDMRDLQSQRPLREHERAPQIHMERDDRCGLPVVTFDYNFGLPKSDQHEQNHLQKSFQPRNQFH